MIEEIGVIKAVDQDHIWVETQIKSTCGSCQAESNCGTGTVAKAFSPKTETLVLRCAEKARVGQRVRLGIPEQALLGASALMYLLPLFALVGSALLGQWLMPQFGLVHEGYLIAFTLAMTALCFLQVRKHLQTDSKQQYHPRLLGLLPPEQQVIEVQQIELQK